MTTPNTLTQTTQLVRDREFYSIYEQANLLETSMFEGREKPRVGEIWDIQEPAGDDEYVMVSYEIMDVTNPFGIILKCLGGYNNPTERITLFWLYYHGYKTQEAYNPTFNSSWTALYTEQDLELLGRVTEYSEGDRSRLEVKIYIREDLIKFCSYKRTRGNKYKLINYSTMDLNNQDY